ncbi:MAG: dUTP diphosphatase [Candidatus Woesearchaeota archaeon]
MVKVKIHKMSDKAVLPQYQTDESAGVDLHAAESCIVKKGERRLISTGLRFALPKGYEGHVRPRSGLAVKHGISVLNTPGTLDSDYRGELMVLLINHGEKDFKVEQGDRIAQLILTKYEKMELEEDDNLEDTKRGKGGFGSTGVK